MTQFQRIACAAAAALLLVGGAQAQSAGSITGRVSLTRIGPDVQSGDLTAPSFPGTQADIHADTQLTGGVTWALSDEISIDLPIAFGFTHDIVGAGAIAGVGKIGEVKALPATLLVQYRFMEAGAALRPYVGFGPTYARFYKARSTAALSGLTGGSPSNPTTLSVDNKFTVSAQLGLAAKIDDRWGLDLAVLYTPLKTRTTLSTGQTLDAKLNPTTITAGVSYRF